MQPLPSSVLPDGVRARILPGINGLDIHVLEAGLRDAGPAGRPAAAWLSRARLQLAQGDAGAGRGRLPRHRARPARLWPHDGLGCRLRRRPRWLPCPEPGARCDGRADRPRPSHGRGRGRPRFRRLARRLRRADAARHFQAPGADERAVRRAAAAGRPAGSARPRAPTSTPRSRPCRGRASITSGTTRRVRPTTTCGRRRRACTTSCAPTIITRAPTGRPTSRSS